MGHVPVALRLEREKEMTGTETDCATVLREEMMKAVIARGFSSDDAVLRVMSQVPRHRFVPEASLENAHNPWRAVITHRFEDGRSLSCASAPFVVAMMLDQLSVKPGNKVLEIGAGTGYNASLLSELTGASGHVTTIDIDTDVTAAAERNLSANGYPAVEVVTGDGTFGVDKNAPYDRLIATVSPWDIPKLWWEQLAPDARVVVPLRWRGQARSVALQMNNGVLIADDMQLCGFVPLTGPSEGELEGAITNDDRVKIHWDRDQEVDLAKLFGVLDYPITQVWSGVTIANDESWDSLWLRLTVTQTSVCRLNVSTDVSATVCNPIAPIRTPALVRESSIAYLVSRQQETAGVMCWELGAAGHGPASEKLISLLVEDIRKWNEERAAAQPRLTIYPKGHAIDADESQNAATLEKYDSVITLKTHGA